MKSLLCIKNLSVSIEDKLIINNLSLTLEQGKIHAIMGPNGSGKSTLAYTLLGHPSYTVTAGSITFKTPEKELDLVSLATHERAKAGIFLAFQYPYELEGIKLKDFLRQAYNNLYAGTEKQIGLKAFRELLEKKCALLNIKPELLERDLNVGFSGGEKKKTEMLQLAILQPSLAILDEIDSGLDIDALQSVAQALKALIQEHPNLTLLIITHYQRILDHLKPDKVYVMQQGTVTNSGDADLALEVEKSGYQQNS